MHSYAVIIFTLNFFSIADKKNIVIYSIHTLTHATKNPKKRRSSPYAPALTLSLTSPK